MWIMAIVLPLYRIEVPISIVQEECVCDPNPVTMNCLNSSDNIFILEYPRKCFDNMTICHWNLPQADQVYMHLLKQDIEGNPNDGASGCKDKLIMKSESWSLVTCGKLPTTRPATRIYNRIHNEVPSVFFFSENGMEGCFQILVYLESRMVRFPHAFLMHIPVFAFMSPIHIKLHPTFAVICLPEYE